MAVKRWIAHYPWMDDKELKRLLEAERLAHERYERFRGYPEDIQAATLAIWTEAKEAVQEYRAKHP
jgi:hypothetical protein